MNPIYLDYNATTPVDPAVAEAMIPILKDVYGNPSSVHSFGQEAKRTIEEARKKLASLIGAKPYEIIFTSGGTESNNLAIKGIAYARKKSGQHIITTKIEHPAVLEVCRNLENEGFEISYLDVDKYGIIKTEQLSDAIRPDTILISIMHANNETGSIQPVSEVKKIIKDNNIIFHCDAAQSVGKIPVNVQEMGVDLLSVAGHKFYAPKGIGALYIRAGTTLEKIMHGANHEQNLRPGTENILEITGLGRAAEIAEKNLSSNSEKMQKTRDQRFQLLKNDYPELILNGHPEKRLPNTLNVSFPGIDVSLLLSELKNVAASAGAACHADTITYSHVLKAMGISPDQALGTMRLSTGKITTLEEIKIAAASILQKVKELNSGQSKKQTLDAEQVKLTEFTHGLGCACKISPRILENILKDMPKPDHPDILVGSETSDDAAVYRIDKDKAIVQTVDFFTPVVDDPFQFGAIAAANALSDIYAMGAKPIFGLNIVAFPQYRLPLSALREILSGAQEVCDEAGISILGGHTIEDNEPKFGMVISGLVHPDKIIRNKGGMAGDVLVLTKAIGTGILSTALKRGQLPGHIKEELYLNMRSLNKISSEIMTDFNIHAATDVTGFGLLGHLKEMCEASGKGAVINYSNVPLLSDIEMFATQGFIPGGTENNRQYVEDFIKWDKNIAEFQKNILADAQTSGGLLIAINQDKAKFLIEKLRTHNVSAHIIGHLSDSDKFMHIKK